VASELHRMERILFQGLHPEIGGEDFESALQVLAEFEVGRYTQELVLLVSRLGWLDILFNKVAERAKETKNLNKVKARVLQDIKVIYGKVISWISSPTVQRLAAKLESCEAEPFSFPTSPSEVRNWSLEKDVFEGNFPWMRSARDTNDDVQQSMKRKLAQRLRVVYSVMKNFAHSILILSILICST